MDSWLGLWSWTFSDLDLDCYNRISKPDICISFQYEDERRDLGEEGENCNFQPTLNCWGYWPPSFVNRESDEAWRELKQKIFKQIIKFTIKSQGFEARDSFQCSRKTLENNLIQRFFAGVYEQKRFHTFLWIGHKRFFWSNELASKMCDESALIKRICYFDSKTLKGIWTFWNDI